MSSAEDERVIKLPNGIQISLLEKGQNNAITVVFCHGWPDISYAWRHQWRLCWKLQHDLHYLAQKGYRGIAPDLRGYNRTTSPASKNITEDLIGLLDALKIHKAVFVGHDWGSPVVWSMVQHYPERVLAVASLIVPFYPPNPKKNPLKGMMNSPGRFDYQLYFQEEGRAESELDRDVLRSLRCTIRSTDPRDRIKLQTRVSLANVRERGGFLVGFPEAKEIPRTIMWTEEDERRYVEAYPNSSYYRSLCRFTRSGFRGPINWYRNVEENWEWSCLKANTKIEHPTLMVTVGNDKLFPPEMIEPMKPLFTNLSIAHIQAAGHWVQQEEPNQLNEILSKWLLSLRASKL